MDQGRVIYRGYVDDPRNTDHAWMETTAKHLHLSGEISERMNLQAGDDAQAVRWLPLTLESMLGLYASHCTLIIKTLAELVHNNPSALSAKERETIANLLDTVDNERTSCS